MSRRICVYRLHMHFLGCNIMTTIISIHASKTTMTNENKVYSVAWRHVLSVNKVPKWNTDIELIFEPTMYTQIHIRLFPLTTRQNGLLMFIYTFGMMMVCMYVARQETKRLKNKEPEDSIYISYSKWCDLFLIEIAPLHLVLALLACTVASKERNLIGFSLFIALWKYYRYYYWEMDEEETTTSNIWVYAFFCGVKFIPFRLICVIFGL